MAIVIALAIHELGHIIAAVVLGIEFQRVKITLMGFNLNANLENISMIRKNILYFAGPFLNFIVFCILINTKYYDFAKINLFLSLINLVPVVPLDGGNICKAILTSIINCISVSRYMIMTNCFFIICFMLIFLLYKKWLYILFVVMAVRGIIEENTNLFEYNIKLHYYNRIKRK